MVEIKKSLTFVMFVTLAFVASIFAVNANDRFELEQVEIDGHIVNPSETLTVENGQVLDVELKLKSLISSDDNRIRIWLNGYEHGDLLDTVGPFSAVQNNTFYKTLKVQLPTDMKSQKDYTLRIEIEGEVVEYTVYVDTQRHRIDILDLVLTPSYGVEAGQNVIAEVRMKNRGQKDQESVKVSIAIPKLGVIGSGYVSDLDVNEAVTSDEILLFIPETAASGTYDVVVETKFNDGYTEKSKIYSLNILGQQEVPEKALIAGLPENIDLKAGVTSTFTVTIGNENPTSKPISIAPVQNAWADVEVSPSLAMIQGGSDATFTVSVTPKVDISGERLISLQVKDANKIISDLKVNAYVEKKAGFSAINIALVVLLVIAIIVLIALLVSGGRKKDSDDEYSSNEEYY